MVYKNQHCYIEIFCICLHLTYKYTLNFESVMHAPEIFTHLLLSQSKIAEEFEMTSQTVKENLIHFIRIHEMPLVTEYNGKVCILEMVLDFTLNRYISKKNVFSYTSQFNPHFCVGLIYVLFALF